MKIEIELAGITYTSPATLEIRQGKSFPGSGKILSSAIVRESKNSYRVYVIIENYAWNRTCSGMKQAKAYLETTYKTWGGFLNLGT